VTTSRPREAERARIVEGFIAVVAERGYAATSVAEVLGRTGVDEATFHGHFEDEAACFQAAWEFVSNRYMPNALAAYQGASGWRQQIRAVGQAILGYLLEHPDHGRILFVEGPDPDEPGRALDPNVDVFIELIDGGRREMDDPSVLTRATAEGIAGAVNERIAVCLRQGADEELPKLLPELMYLVVLPYLGSRAAIEELHRGAD
jgi:AcrR family transcriptional regulator